MVFRGALQPAADSVVALGPSLTTRNATSERQLRVAVVGEAFRQLRRRAPFRLTYVDFAEVALVANRQIAERRSDDRGRLLRARQDARVERGYLAELPSGGEPLVQRRRLLPPKWAQPRARVVPGEEPLRLRVRLAVANNEQPGRAIR